MVTFDITNLYCNILPWIEERDHLILDTKMTQKHYKWDLTKKFIADGIELILNNNFSI